ncbi:beta family protein [Acinetobacter sp. WCHA39]|uniref:beta family protein n=1 Tax=Acinetobacter sp. WCHA39 TaxID=2004648 RepID=UPI001D0D6263|nr:beta family protein [Acinetobacter sp. WCHA39]
MTISFKYVPILQTKQNEYAALSELQANIKQYVKPLFSLTNSEKERRAQVLPKQILDRWGNLPCYIDLDTSRDFLIENQYYANWIFDKLYNLNLSSIDAVVSLSSSSAMFNAVNNAIINFGVGLAFRIDITEIGLDTLQKINNLLNFFNLTPSDVDLIIDYGENIQSSSFLQFQSIQLVLNHLTSGIVFKNIIVASSSMPKELPRDDYNPHGFIPRIEWQAFVLNTNTHTSIPYIFSDYASVHPEEFESDGPVKPNAKIKYTLDDNYMMVVRYQAHVHADGFEQYHDMATHLINSGYYYGHTFSSGDQYIYDCSARSVGPGNFGTWVKVSVNHHITVVINQIATLSGISV